MTRNGLALSAGNCLLQKATTLVWDILSVLKRLVVAMELILQKYINKRLVCQKKLSYIVHAVNGHMQYGPASLVICVQDVANNS